MVLFKKGGNFSKKEVDLFKNKIRLLENKTIRFYQVQVREMNAKLPEMVEKGKKVRFKLVQTKYRFRNSPVFKIVPFS